MQVTIELKNDICITGTLKSVDQFLNIKLDEIRVKDESRYPHLVHNPHSTHKKSNPNADTDIGGGEERFHPWICRALRPFARERGRYRAVGGCD